MQVVAWLRGYPGSLVVCIMYYSSWRISLERRINKLVRDAFVV